MICKPTADWQQRDEGATVRTVRTAAAVAAGSARVARRGGQALVGLFSYGVAAFWGVTALASGLGGSLPSLIGIGAMVAGMIWVGRRAFAKARETSV